MSVRLHGDEVYRCTKKEDGQWVTCDRFDNGIGDNIALVQELEPGTGFAESVYRLSGAPSVSGVTRPALAPVKPRQPPRMPAQSDQDVRQGREYLRGHGISMETIEQAEKAEMLRYSAGGVLFVGRDEQGTAQNIMRRAVNASDPYQERDLAGTDNRHPQVLLGSPETVLVVEVGTDALAAVDMARRQNRPQPTVLVSGGSNVRSWIETPWVQAILKLARRVIVALAREKASEVQAKTDAVHDLQMQRLREVCGGDTEVTSRTLLEGVKDMAELNAKQQAYEEARKREAVAQQEVAATPEQTRHPVPRGG